MSSLNRNSISTFILGGFITVLLIGSLVSEFFQAPIISSQELSKFQFLFTREQVDTVNFIKIKSSLGEYQLERKDFKWNLTSPRLIDANINTIEKILSSLKEVKIKKIYPKDAINLANFSLDNPISTLTIKNEKNEEKSISFGLVNPIDNSTYVSVEDEKAIYHINNINMPFERIELTSLIDSRIFNMEWNEIKSFKMVSHVSTRPTLSFVREKKLWVSGNRQLNDERMKKYLTELTSLKSTIILDERTEKLDKTLERYLTKPLFKLNIQTEDDSEIEYRVSYIITSLPGIKMERKQNFIIKASNRQHPFLVNKEFMRLFYKKTSHLKPIPIKKLIY